jgi:lysophospholipase L1-like esterase
MKHRYLWFWTAFVVFLVAVSLAGLEVLSAFVVPPWPARELRAIEVPPTGYNSWGMRDREHTLHKPAGIDFRAVLVGDSFLEGGFVSSSVGTRVEALWSASGRRDMEAVTLGISATGPPQYYYRIRDIALPLQPDALLLVFFSGNDFVSEPLPPWWRPSPPIAERPQPSWLGTVAPRLTWLTVNRLGLSEFGRGNRGGTSFDAVNAILEQPRSQRLESVTRLVKTDYYPQKDEATIRAILGRGGDRFWDAFEKRDRDQEHLQAWWLAGMVDWETGTWPVALTAEEIERSVNRAEVDATMTWLVGAAELARARGVKFLIALAPPPTLDPRYAEFWSPWPRYRSFPMARLAWHRALRAALEAKGLPVADLADDLKDIPGTYRFSDGHWTELGTDIAAKRLSDELLKMRPTPSR